MNPAPRMFYWKFCPVDELTRDELLEVINDLAAEREQLIAAREEMRPYTDYAAYLTKRPLR